MDNLQRCLKKVNKVHKEIETIEQLKECLDVMSKKSRILFVAKWGLDTSRLYCDNFEELDKKLKIRGSKILYKESLCEFDYAALKLSYAKLLNDYKNNFDLAVCIGTFLARLFDSYTRPEELPAFNATIEEMVSRLDKAFKVLNDLERIVIVTKYGLIDYDWYKSDLEVSKLIGKSTLVIIQTETRAFEKLRRKRALSIIKGK